MMPRVEWQPTPISDLPQWAGAKRVAFDVETRDSQLRKLGCGVRRDGYMVGYSFAIEDGPSHYVPFRHEGGGNLSREQAFRYLRDQAKGFKGELVGGSLQYDLDYAGTEAGAYFKSVKRVRDVQVAEPLIDEHQYNFSLDHLAEKYNLAKKDERVMREAADAYGIDPKSGLWRLPAKFVGDYAERDVTLPLEI
jgi:DNA polymerase I-like protein with 3'-5' exonuclease and polymerase domains